LTPCFASSFAKGYGGQASYAGQAVFYNKNKTWCLGGFVVKIKAELEKRNNDKIIV
jgi:hypothetical protein